MKVDVETGETKVWCESEFRFPCQPTFIANPNGTEEDDGVIIFTITDVRKDNADSLIVLDARTLDELARADVNSDIPNCMHGIYLPDKF